MTTDTHPAPQNAEAFFDAVEHRRSYYNLTKEAILSNDQLEELVKRAVKHTPSAFNMQQSRAVLITGAANQKLWDVVVEAWNRGEEDEEKRNGFKGQVDNVFRKGYGSVLFFEDQAVLDDFSGKFPGYSSSFNGAWSDNTAGILQYIVWTALEAEGYGASLQHFGGIKPAVHQALIDTFGLPQTWTKNTAIMPFGKPSGGPGKPGTEKEFKPLDDRVLVLNE